MQRIGLCSFVIPLLILVAGSTFSLLYWVEARTRKVREMKFNAIKSFKERLAKKGVVDETEDIARANRLTWVNDETISLQPSLVKGFAEIVNVGERTYVIHTDTLKKLLNKLPINKKGVSKLSDKEQQILDIILAAGIVSQEKNGVFKKNCK